jgi:hypothetical protein
MWQTSFMPWSASSSLLAAVAYDCKATVLEETAINLKQYQVED